MRRRRFYRVSLMTLLLSLTAVASLIALLRSGYAREQKFLRPLQLDAQDREEYFNTPITEYKISTDGYILTKWIGPAFLESPMRRIGCPWFDRADSISIWSDEHLSADELRSLSALRHLKQVRITYPKKTEQYYRQLTDHFHPFTTLDVNYHYLNQSRLHR